MHINKDIIYYFLFAVGVLFFSVIGYYEYQSKKDVTLVRIPSEQAVREEENKKEGATRTVTLFYYNSSVDTDESGNSMCSEKGIVPVTRTIQVTVSPIQDTIQMLIKGELTQEEKAQGISTEFPLEEVSVKSVALQNNGILRIDLQDPLHKTVGGSCRTAILYRQMVSTARQFPEVADIEIINKELFQP